MTTAANMQCVESTKRFEMCVAYREEVISYQGYKCNLNLASWKPSLQGKLAQNALAGGDLQQQRINISRQANSYTSLQTAVRSFYNSR